MHSHIPAIREALLALEGVGSVTRGQPRQNARLPCVAISQQSAREACAYDDRAYLTRSDYLLRLFGPDADALDALAEAIDGALTPLGFRCALAADAGGEDVKQKVMTYQIAD